MKEKRCFFAVKGEYSDYFSMMLTETAIDIISEFLKEFNLSVDNVSIKMKVEE